MEQSPKPPGADSQIPSASPAPPPAPGFSPKGRIHVKLVQARDLRVRSNARPYVVVHFEQNKFVSRDPTGEEVKDTPTTLAGSCDVVPAIGVTSSEIAAGRSSRRGKEDSVKSTYSSLGSSIMPPASALSNGSGVFGHISASNPVWKHEVSFDLMSEASLITCDIYDRAVAGHGFLGTVQIKPVLIPDYMVDQWYKLRSFEGGDVSGEMRAQVTFEQCRTTQAPSPRDFEFLRLVGCGTSGKVFQVRKRDSKRIYAVKVLSKKELVEKEEVAHAVREHDILQRSLDSPFLVGLQFSFQTDTGLFLVMDFKSGGELFWHLQRETRFSEERARFYTAELVLALEYLHQCDIVYRDLKPENILLDAAGHVALCDFGLSKPDLRSNQLTSTFCGTTEYVAPEMLLDERGYSRIVDFWSLGVLLFEMCCGWSPFYADNTQKMYENICYAKIRLPKGAVHEDGKQFIKGLLNRNPKHRLGAVKGAEELKEHPFFASINWAALSRKQVEPPFKPVVESDESTANFDETFTSADLHELGLVDADLEVGEKDLLLQLQGINIEQERKTGTVGRPLMDSVQGNFRGFTYSGRESVVVGSENIGTRGGQCRWDGR